jgi:hypothetical protein
MELRRILPVAVAFLIAVFGSQSFGQGSGPVWAQLSPSGGPPQLFNYQPTVVLDPASNRMVLYGRNFGGTSEVWVLTNSNGLNGAPKWIQLSPAGGPPPNRGNHFAVYDTNSNRMMIFGGCGGGCLPILNDVWVLTNANGLGGTPTWIQLFPTGGPPAPRHAGAAGYDPATNRMIIFGGQNGSGFVFPFDTFPDVWVLSNANGMGGTPSWTQLSPVGGPPPGQYAPTSIYDTINNRLVVAGGAAPSSSGSGVFTNATWVLSNANGLGGIPTWTNIVPEGAAGPPPAFGSQTAVYGPSHNRMIMILAGAAGFDDWILTNANGLGGTPVWGKISSTGGPPQGSLLGNGAVYDTTNNLATVVFFTTSNQPWVLAGANGISTVTTTTTTLSPLTPVTYGTPVTFIATVAPAPTGIPVGTVTFNDGTTVLGSGIPNGSGVATFTTSARQLTAGSHSITASYNGNTNFASSTSLARTHTVNLRPLTISATGVNKVYDGTTTATVTLADNRVGGDAFTDSFSNASFADKNVGAGKTVQVSGISISGTDAGNYTFNTTANTTANITARTLMVTATGVNKVYDGTTTATVTLADNRVGGDVFTDSFSNASFADKNVGVGKTVSVTGISISGPDAGNYALVSTTASTTADITVNTGLRFVPVTPCRVADTRNANGPFGGPFLSGQTSRGFAISSSACNIPATAQAYSLNVTVVPHGPLGFLTTFPCGQSQPLVSTLNSIDGRVKAVAAIVPAGTNGDVCFFVTNDTELVLDIEGYFVPTATPNSLSFYPVTPCRLVDTRLAAGALGGPSLVGNATGRTFPILSSPCNLPAVAQAYSLNYTSVPKTGTLGFLTTWPAGQLQPLVSTLNAPTGAVTANAAIVPAGTGGAVQVFVTNDSDLIIDVNGYFAPPATGGLALFNLSPCRVLDTRNPSGSPPLTGAMNVNVVASGCGAPASALAYVLNATVVPPSQLGFLTLWPQGGPQPLVSTLNAIDGAVTSNMALVPTTNGSVSAFALNPSHLVLDISGYFAPVDITVNVALNPANTFSVTSGGTVQVIATVVSAGHPDANVTWSVNGVTNGNSTVGQITATGVGTATYTAPAVPPSVNPVTITATSVADPSRSGSVPLKIASVLASQSQLIKAAQGGTITLSDGSGVVIPPGALASDQTVTLQLVTDLPNQPPSGLLANVGPGLLLTLSTPNTGALPSSGTFTSPFHPNQTSSSSDPNDLQFTVNISNTTAAGIQGAGGMAYLSDTAGTLSAIGSSATPDASSNNVTMKHSVTLLGGVKTIGVSLVNFVASAISPPPAGSRHWDGTNWHQSSGFACPSGRVLVLVHGMKSTVEDAFSKDGVSCAQTIADAGGYDDIEGFDYDWTQGINTSGQQLAGFLDNLASCPSVTGIDIEGHSEGVPVSGSAITQATAAQPKIRNFVALGGPIAGTPWADLAELAVQQQVLPPPPLTTLLGNIPLSVETVAGIQTLQSLAGTQFFRDLQISSSVLPGIWQKLNAIPTINTIVACGNKSTFTRKVLASLNLSLLTTLIPNDNVIPTSSCLGQNSGLSNPHSVGTFDLTHTDLECDKSPNGVIQAVGNQVKQHGPVLKVNPGMLTFTAPLNGPTQNATLAVSSSGSVVAWTTTTDASWLSLSAPSGLASAAVPANTTVSANVTGLLPGDYSAKIVFSSAQASNSPLTVPVALHVGSFDLTVSVTGTGSGSISVNPPGTSCGPNCSSYSFGTVVQVTETPDTGSVFAGWGGACSGTGTCNVTMNQDMSVTADFEPSGPPAPVTGTWAGSWTRPITGLCAFETSSLNWNLTQVGNNVTGTFREVVTAIDPNGLCPDSVGNTSSGNLVNGVITGNSLTISTDGGTGFSGTVTSTTITGTGGGSLGTGPFMLTRQ